MKNISGIITKIKHFSKLFKDKRTYEVFKVVINGILCLKDWSQGDLANFGEKTLYQIQYFFNESKCDFKILDNLRLQWIRNKVGGARDKISDILILDGSIFTKNKSSKFGGLTSFKYSNKDKKVVNGLELFGASIHTKNGLKYVLDLSIFQKGNEKRDNFSHVNHAWRKFIMIVVKKTKSWLVVLDSGFKGANMCKWIYQVMKRHFLVRIWEGQKFINEYGKEFKISELLLKSTAMYFPNGRMF